MTLENQIKEIVFLLILISAILFTVGHFFIGLIFFRQILGMKNIVRTKARGCVVFFSLIHLLILFASIILVILIEVI